MLAAALALLAALPADSTSRPAGDVARWTPVARFDAVAVDVDARGLVGGATHTVWVRWRLADRAVSPSGWDAGARTTLDLLEVDCTAGAARTHAAAALDADGAELPALAYASEAPEWRTPGAATLGGIVVAGVCRLAGGTR